MPRLTTFRRRSAVLALSLMTASLASCGQIGPLFLRMPDVVFPAQAPIIVGEPTRIFLPEGVTLPAPVSVTSPTPVAATRAAPAGVTSLSPPAVTHP